MKVTNTQSTVWDTCPGVRLIWTPGETKDLELTDEQVKWFIACGFIVEGMIGGVATTDSTTRVPWQDAPSVDKEE